MPFRYAVFSGQVPYIACRDKEPLLAFLFAGGAWRPLMERKTAEEILHREGEVPVHLSNGASTICYVLKEMR